MRETELDVDYEWCEVSHGGLLVGIYYSLDGWNAAASTEDKVSSWEELYEHDYTLFFYKAPCVPYE